MSKGRPRIADDVARITITIPAALLAQIDDHWHARRFGSRSEAIRDLVENAIRTSGPKSGEKSG